MAKQALQADVLVLGEHPSASFAAALLAHKSRLTIVHSGIPRQTWPDRLVRINPALFSLHPLLAPLKRKLELSPAYGLQFLSQDGSTRSAFAARSATVCIGGYRQIRSAFEKLAAEQGVTHLSPRTLQIRGVDETGADVQLGSQVVRAQAIIVAGELPAELKQALAIPDGWDDEIAHRYAWLKLRSPEGVSLGAKPLVQVSLDLLDQQAHGWVLAARDEAQLGVMIRVALLRETPLQQVMQRWVEVLVQHGILDADEVPRLEDMESLDLPLAGGLSQEGVANRTLLAGPAGGFFSASGEDIYPNCWSALHAAEAMKKALKEPHLQDALGAYRARWRTTLGDYLRGPQQNLRFLLPLVYRNAVMTTRLAEAILLGKSVVR